MQNTCTPMHMDSPNGTPSAIKKQLSSQNRDSDIEIVSLPEPSTVKSSEPVKVYIAIIFVTGFAKINYVRLGGFKGGLAQLKNEFWKILRKCLSMHWYCSTKFFNTPTRIERCKKWVTLCEVTL